MKRLGCVLLFLLCCQTSSATSVRLITIGPGDAFWSAFGHTAIAIDDAVYGFGYFSFDDDLVSSFIRNQMEYDIGISDFNHEIYLAQQQNRDFSVIELNLSAADSKQLIDYLQWHILPENQSYSYDYFLNNCFMVYYVCRKRGLKFGLWSLGYAKRVRFCYVWTCGPLRCV